jgi:hypothetical protein
MLKFVRNTIGAKVVRVAGVSIAGVMLVSNVYLVAMSRERLGTLVVGRLGWKQKRSPSRLTAIWA